MSVVSVAADLGYVSAAGFVITLLFGWRKAGAWWALTLAACDFAVAAGDAVTGRWFWSAVFACLGGTFAWLWRRDR